VRGFAIKFTPRKATGIWSATTPRCFRARPYSSPIHPYAKAPPKTNLAFPHGDWDFWSLSPESLHQVTILMSDRGLPPACAMSTAMARTYSLINAAGSARMVKFHFKTQQGHRYWTKRAGFEVVGRTRRIDSGGSVRGNRERRFPEVEDRCRS